MPTTTSMLKFIFKNIRCLVFRLEGAIRGGLGRPAGSLPFGTLLFDIGIPRGSDFMIPDG